jgi:hypothetical protein
MIEVVVVSVGGWATRPRPDAAVRVSKAIGMLTRTRLMRPMRQARDLPKQPHHPQRREYLDFQLGACSIFAHKPTP